MLEVTSIVLLATVAELVVLGLETLTLSLSLSLSLSLFIIVLEFVALAGGATSAGSDKINPLSCVYEFPIEGNIPPKRIVSNIMANIGYCLIKNIISISILSPRHCVSLNTYIIL
jgi:hypothetical protein